MNMNSDSVTLETITGLFIVLFFCIVVALI